MTLTGSATLEGTTRYRDRFKDSVARGHFRQQHGLVLSSIGSGSYLGNADDETDARYAAARIGPTVCELEGPTPILNRSKALMVTSPRLM